MENDSDKTEIVSPIHIQRPCREENDQNDSQTEVDIIGPPNTKFVTIALVSNERQTAHRNLSNYRRHRIYGN